MKTNLKTIIKFRPCSKGIAELMNNLGHLCVEENWEEVYELLSKKQQNKSIDFKFILESNRVKDTFWALCTQPKKIRMLIGADVVESVLHIYEKQYPNDNRMRDYIQGIRDYCNGEITKAKLNTLKIDVAATYGAFIVDAATAVATAGYDAAHAAVCDTANNAAFAVYTAAADAYAAAAYNAAYNAVFATDATAYKEQWEKNEEILLKYI